MSPKLHAASKSLLAAKLLTVAGIFAGPLYAQNSAQQPTEFVPNQSGINQSLQGTNTPGVNAPINPNQNQNRNRNPNQDPNQPANENDPNNTNLQNQGTPGGFTTGGFGNGFFNGPLGAGGAMDSHQALAMLIVVKEQQLAQMAQLAVQQSANEDVKAFAQAQLNATQQILGQLGWSGATNNVGSQDPLQGRNNTRNARNPDRDPRSRDREPRNPDRSPRTPDRGPPLAEPHTNSAGNTANQNANNTNAINNPNAPGNQVTPFGSNGVGMRNQFGNQTGGHDLISVHQQIAQETSNHLQRVLQGQSDTSFDLAFLHFTIAELSETLATMQAIAQNGGVMNGLNQNGNALNGANPNDGNVNTQDARTQNQAPNGNLNGVNPQNAAQAGVGQVGVGNLQGVLNAAIQQTQLALNQAEQLAQQLSNDSNGNPNRIRRSDLPRSERGRITP